jgi:hypothetical protein
MSTTQTETPWAVLLCMFNDNSTAPFTRRFYENLFTNAGVGLGNMVDYFRDYSHGTIDLGGSRVFGWLTLPESLAVANTKPREHILTLAKQTATNAGVDLSPFWGVIVCTNVVYQTFGFQNGQAAVADAAGMFPGILGQEIGHGYGLDHSRINGSTADYRDPWDVMSALNSWRATDPQFNQTGPGLNAANMDGRGWLDAERVWSQGGLFDQVLQLRPHHRRDLDGFLVARVGPYYVEYRNRERWDAAVPRSAVLVHRLDGNRSYLMPGTAGNADLQLGDVFQAVDGANSARVEVTGLDAQNRMATVRLTYQSTLRTAKVLVTPYPTPMRRQVTITVHANDAQTNAPVAGQVLIHNFTGGRPGAPIDTPPFPTNTPQAVTLRPRQIFEPELRTWIDDEWPSGVVSAPGYEDVEIDFGL